MDKTQKDTLAIVGIGCRFPGNVVDVDSYWHLLKNGIDAITEIPAGRIALWQDANIDSRSFPRYGGFLKDIDLFDPYFFNLSPRESEAMDPQQRLLVEVSHEAFDNAGLSWDVLTGSSTGVFVGLWTSDYEKYLLENNRHVNLYMTTGTGRYAAAGRLSYIFDLRGPCMTIDTACSSSLVAAHLACQSLLTHECDIAIAAGVNLILMPHISQAYMEAGILSPDGRCRFADKNANGYVRSEGCGVVVLKRLSKALEDHDRIYALIRGSAVNNDGRQGLFVAPTREGQKAVLLSAHKTAAIDVDNLCFVEAHGTGTAVGDPTEIESLGEFLREQGRSTPCPIGSVKTNIGHCEAAAGVASLIKAALILHHGYIPPSLHLTEKNPKIDWQALPVEIQRSGGKLKATGTPPTAGVNSFGITGTNSHMVLEQARNDTSTASRSTGNNNNESVLIPLSGHSPEALRETVAAFSLFVAKSPDRLEDIAYSTAMRRSHYPFRATIVANSHATSAARLLELAGSPPNAFSSVMVKPQKLTFVFSGQGPQWHAMGRDLYCNEPVYRDMIDECSRLIARHVPWSLSRELSASKEESRIHMTEIGQPAIFALQMGIAALWQSWGILPDACVGHSIGEVAAACAGGILSLEDAVKVVYNRGRALSPLADCGEMAAVGLDITRTQKLIAPYNGSVCIAAVNAPESMTISGDSKSVADIVGRLEKQGIFARSLNVGYPYHSPMVDSVRDKLVDDLVGLLPNGAVTDVYSTVTGRKAAPDDYDARYWGANVRQPVMFMQAIQTLIDDGYTAFMEVGPQPVLASAISQCLESRDKIGWLAHSLRRGINERETMLTGLGQCYLAEHPINWKNVYTGANRFVSLPAYAWQKKSFWLKRVTSTAVSVASVPDPLPKSPALQSFPDPHLQYDAETSIAANCTDLPLNTVTPSALKDIDNWRYHIQWQELQPKRTPPSSRMNTPDGMHLATQDIREKITATISREILAERKLFLEQLEALSLDYILQAFDHLGWTYHPGESFKTTSLFNVLGISENHRRLVGRLLEILCEEGILIRKGAELHIVRKPKVSDPVVRSTDLLNRFGNYSTELTLLNRCGSNLHKVLTGEQDPLQLLFPEGAADTLDKLYTNAVFSRDCNQAIAKLFNEIGRRRPHDKKLRILEIGAGTGGTTAHILPLLAQSNCEYVFTDVSTLFLNRAEIKFQPFPFVKYHRLDIARFPRDQGFEDEYFDLIVAANVMHATADLRQSLRNAKSLLAIGGSLILLEGTSPRRWIDLIFGLLEGWWLFSDKDIRPDYPLLQGEQWSSILKSLGFGETHVVPVISAPASALFDQALIIAGKSTKLTAKAAPEEEQSAPASPKVLPVMNNYTWLIFSDAGDYGTHLAKYLHSLGDVCVSVHRGESVTRTGDHHFTLRPAWPEDYDAVLMEAQQSVGKPFSGLIYLWGLDIPAGTDIIDAAAEESRVFGCGSLLSLVQALGRNQQIDVSRLSVITRGAQFITHAPRAESLPLALLQASLWGLGRVVRLEYPDLKCTLIDLDPTEENIDAARLAAELRQREGTGLPADAESQIAFRRGRRFAARLIQTRPTVSSTVMAQYSPDALEDHIPFPNNFFSPDHTYLIAGGYGGIGLLTAEWMISNGAKHLALLGRSGHTDASRQAMAVFEKMGAHILTIQGDVSIERDVREALTSIQSQSPPLRGVIHAAGVLEDGVMALQNWDRFEKVLAPKIAGAWHLHQLTQQMNLDFFLLYSSWAAIMGSAGQSNHAAANAFLDALAHYRRASGLPAISINWGPWSGQGAAAHSDIGQKLASRGLGHFTPQQGLELLGRILQGNASQEAVMPLNFDRWLETYPTLLKSRFFEHVLPSGTSPTKPKNPSAQGILDKAADIQQRILAAATTDQQKTALRQYLQDQLTSILRIPPAELDSQKSFKDLGLDSLTGLEMRNRINLHLAITLSATAVWNYPSIDQMVAHIATLLHIEPTIDDPKADEAANTAEPTTDQELASLLDELDGLSEDEVQRLLSENLERGGSDDD